MTILFFITGSPIRGFRETNMAPSVGFVFLLLIATEYVLGGLADGLKRDVGAFFDAPNIYFTVVGGETCLECSSDSYREHVNTIWYGNDDYAWTDEGVGVDNSVVSFLNITDVTFEDAGFYKCKMYYAEGRADVRNFKLHVQANPHIAKQNGTTIEGANITAKCCVEVSSNVVDLDLSWTIDSREIRRTVPTGDSSGNTTNYCDQIVFPSHRSYHNQALTCLILNNLNLSDTTFLRVLYSPSIEVHFSDSLNDQLSDFEEYSEVLFVCFAEGNPKPNITLGRIDTGMELPNVRINSVSDLAVHAEYKSINVSRDMNGVYSCNANNEIGDGTSTAYLHITFAVEIELLTPSPLRVLSNGKCEINCRTTSDPRPKVILQKFVNNEWVFLTTESSHESQREHEYIWMFNLTDAQHDYQGLYRCYASNGVGKPVSSASIEVAVTSENPDMPHRSSAEMSMGLFSVIFMALVAVVNLIAWLVYKRRGSYQLPSNKESKESNVYRLRIASLRRSMRGHPRPSARQTVLYEVVGNVTSDDPYQRSNNNRIGSNLDEKVDNETTTALEPISDTYGYSFRRQSGCIPPKSLPEEHNVIEATP